MIYLLAYILTIFGANFAIQTWGIIPIGFGLYAPAGVLFVGGTTSWKLSEVAYGLVQEAKRRGKFVHMGRCNSRQRLIAAAVGGYDSADGTYVAFGPDKNLPKLMGWLEELRRQPVMELSA
jgi:hypothetical protein